MQEKQHAVQIFAMTHKAFTPPPDAMYVPLQVGRACHEDLGFLADNTGDNISQYNACFSELTGVYWLWKNYRGTRIVGVCHYRRYLIADDGHLYTQAEVERLLMDYDMIVTKKLELRMPYYDGFSATHDEKDLVALQQVIAEKYPEYAPYFERMVHEKETYFANMMICKKELYDAYCAWLFDILFEVQRRIDTTGYDNYRMRVYGFLSEFLLTVWIAKNGLHVYESCVGMSAEKYETGAMKKQLAAYFAAGQIAQAKQYFQKELANRPDVLMEASDIRGELKLCMQLISTCEYEEKRGETRMVDRGLAFAQLLGELAGLNRFAQTLADDWKDEAAFTGADKQMMEPVREYIRTHAVSETAVEIAGMLAGLPAGWMNLRFLS